MVINFIFPNFIQSTPTLFNNLNNIQEDEHLKNLVLGGEKFPQKCPIIRMLLERGVKVWNIYGITELSCWSSIYPVKIEDLE
jgi:hypothetical protein